ncbi:MAG TPA: hypothetical protein VL020_02855 [Pseudomonadales bacterium]|nr:hypothetical protein [Pseudomonadales bacterium]
MAAEYCNWTFVEVVAPYQKWVVARDCENNNDENVDDDSVTFTLSRNDKRNWSAYAKSLEPRYQDEAQNAYCPKCGKEINGVNPYDDGETWRK